MEPTEWPSNRATEDTSLAGFDDFCGREDILSCIADELLPSKNAVTVSGIGKTEIAREFARPHRDSFDAVFWVVADEVAKLSQIVSRDIVKGWLSNPRKHLSASEDFNQPGQSSTEATWLLIFDNADDPMILADYWPQGSGSILITSRDPLAKSMFIRKPSGLDLGPLTQQDSLCLFNHLTPTSDESENDTAQRIADALGGVPLAISQMAGIIYRQDLTFLYETKFDTNLITYRHSLSTVWTFEKLKPQARQLLELCSFLDPDAVEEDLLIVAFGEMLRGTEQFKKIQRDKQKQQVSVHRIVQDAILATMDSTKKLGTFDQIVRVLWADWPSSMPKPSKAPELPQRKSSGGRLHATKLQFVKLLNEAAWYQKERGRTRDSDGFFETTLTICESSTHADRDALLADIYFCLGAIAMDASDFDMSRIYKERSFDLVSKICKELGTANERLYLAHTERGISRIQDKRYEGEADLKEALRILKVLGNHIPHSGEANLSWTLLAQGKFDGCNTLLLDSQAGREKALGKNDRESVRTSLILYALENFRAAQSQWDQSFEYHKRALSHMRATVGDRDFYTANVAHKISEHLNPTAINEALDIWSVNPSAHNNEIARRTILAGRLFKATGKTQKASIALRVACRLRKDINKEDRDVKDLTTEIFDEVVAFWARQECLFL
ncbi:tetratricopeptide repeat domain-containing protein [Xylaria curta]|nr:tetratricopeptide repeat domain-containing protein [Xylaria curta]